MEQRSGVSPAVRALLVTKAGVLAALVASGLGWRALDVALWTVLSGLAALMLLSLLPLVRPRIEPAAPSSSTVVLPERSAATSGPDPAVQARAGAVDAAREAVLEARRRGAELDELLALADGLHEATLDLARATQSAGGYVEPALRSELALRDRARLGVEAARPVRLGDPTDADGLRGRTQ